MRNSDDDPRIQVGNWEILLDPETHDLQITARVISDAVIVIPGCSNVITVRMVERKELDKLRPRKPQSDRRRSFPEPPEQA